MAWPLYELSQSIKVLHHVIKILFLNILRIHVSSEQLNEVLYEIIVVVVVMLEVHVLLQLSEVALCEQLHQSQNIVYQITVAFEFPYLDIFVCLCLLQIIYCLLDFIVYTHEEDFTRRKILEILPNTSLDISVSPIHKLNCKVDQIIKHLVSEYGIGVI